MKILVTGHRGLIGSNLYKKLSDHEVLGMSRSGGYDLEDDVRVNSVIEEFKPDVVYHLAAEAAEARGQVSPIEMTRRNIGIFVNVLRGAINANVKHFIYTSSVAVYGEAAVPYKENGPTIPKDVYGVNKLACEQILKIMAKVYGFDYTIFRPHNVYGPGQKMSDPYKNVVALFMRSVLEEKPYKLFGNGDMVRAFSYVDDVVDVLLAAIESKSMKNITMNVGSERVVTIKELSNLVQKVSGVKAVVENLPARPQEISSFLADHELQRKTIEYHETPLEAGLKKTWDWILGSELQPIIKKDNEIYVHPKD